MQKKKTRKHLSLFLALSVSLTMLPVMSSSPIVASAATSNVTVDWNQEFQTMDGFGGAIAFNKAYTIRKIYEADPVSGRRLLDMLFDDEKGIGMSIVRCIIGDGGVIDPVTMATWLPQTYDGSSDSIEPTAGNYVWNQPDWAEKKSSFDPDQVWFMQQAMQYGVKEFYATAWTPPYWMKSDNSVLGKSGSTLKTDCYDDYADYIVQFALGYMREFGIPITAISPTNESDSAHASYSGFVFQGAAYKTWLVNYLGPAMQAAAPQFAALGMAAPKICAPEGTNLGASVSTSSPNGYGLMMNDPAVKNVVSVFSTHLYGTTITGPLTASTTSSGTYPSYVRDYTRWQTEYAFNSSDSSANGQLYTSNTITDGLNLANLMTNLFTSDPGFNAYLHWWMMANNGADGSDLIRLCSTGSPQNTLNTGIDVDQARVFKRYYTMGNFSRYVKPDYIRIGATRVPVSGTNISAYKDPVTGKYAIVAVNSSTSSQTINYSLNNFPVDTANAVVGYRTSASENHAKLAPIAIQGGVFTAVLPANTLTTFIPQAADNPPSLAENRDIFSTLETEKNDGASSKVTYSDTAATLGDEDYVKFAKVNFADGCANGGLVRKHILSMKISANTTDNALVEARIGSPDGTVVATFRVPKSTDGNLKTYETQVNTGDQYANDIKDLYITTRTPGKITIDVVSFDSNIVAGNSLWTNSTSTGNLLSMGGFDTTTQSQITSVWSAFGGTSTFASTANQLYSAPAQAASSYNAYSLGITARSAANTGVMQNVASKLVNGETYYANGQFVSAQAGITGTIALSYTDLSGNNVVKPVATRTNMPKVLWNQVSGTFKWDTTNVDTTKPVYLAFYNDSSTDFYIDEVSLSSKPDVDSLISALSATIKTSRYDSNVLQNINSNISTGWALIVNAAATQANVDATTATLNALLANKLTVDTSYLVQIVAKANGLVAGSYTTASWAALQQAVADATAVLASDPTQGETDTAFYAVADAIDNLVFASNKVALKAAIDVAGVIKLANYTQATADSVTAALSYAVSVNSDPAATQTQIDAAYNNLMDAVIALILNQPDPDLLTAISEAQKKQQAKYTAASWAAFDTALHNALVIVADPASTTAQIETALNALKSTMFGLAEKPDTKGLSAAIVTATGIDTSKYLSADITAFEAALAAANAVLADDESTQDEVNAATQVLTAAQLAMKLKADKAAIDALIADITAIDQSKYTDESKAKILALLNKVKGLATGEISQDELEALQTEFTTVKASLTLLSPTNTGTGSTGGTSNPKTGDNGVGLSVFLVALGSAAILVVRRRKSAKR